MKSNRIIFCALALLLSAGLQARPVNVTVKDAGNSGRIIPKEIYGQFSEHLGACIYGGLWVGPESEIPNVDGYRLDVLNALKELSVPVMRWPGGCFADDYHWMDGIGPQEQRTKISNNNWGGTLEDNSFGTHEFLNLCELLGCQPYISGNVGSGSAKELAQWVEYMTSDAQSTMADLRRKNGREEPWKVKYFGIGNEAWGCGGNMVPEYYSNVFRQFGTYTRNYNPEHPLYKIASGASDFDFNWTEVCMQNIGSQMDAIAVHYYTTFGWGPGEKGYASKFDKESYYRILGRAVSIEPCLQKHIAIMDKYDPEGKVDLLVDEWGTWWEVEPGTNPGHLFQQCTMRDAVVAALSLNIFHKYTGRVKMANIAQVVNVLQSMVLTKGDQMVLTPTYYVFKMYKPHQDAEFIPVEYEASVLDSNDKGEVPSLSVTASRKDGAVTVSLVNPSYDKAESVRLDFEALGIKKGSVVSAEVLAAKGDIHDINDFGSEPKVVTRAFDRVKVKDGGLEFEMPAASIVTITVK